MANFMERVRNLFTLPARTSPIDLLERHAKGGPVEPEDVKLAKKLGKLNLLSLKRLGHELHAEITEVGKVIMISGAPRILKEHMKLRPVEGPDQPTIEKLAKHGFIEKSALQLTGSKREVIHAKTTPKGMAFLRTHPRMKEV